MSDEDKSDVNSGPDMSSFGSLFVQLVLSFHAAAWQQMGKVVSIITGKVERDLNMAKHSIDMLGMLEEKTRGNLTEDEERYLKHTLYELRMNYLEEVRRGPEKAEKVEEPADKKPDESKQTPSDNPEESKGNQ